MLLLDDFYNPFEWSTVKDLMSKMTFTATCQPESETIDNRLKAYPCYETYGNIDENNKYLNQLHDLTLTVLKNKTDIQIESLDTAFRRILTKEINQSPLAGQKSFIKHKDKHADMAGVIYFEGLTIEGGTSLFFTELQYEPDIVYAAKPNRAVLYSSDTLHCANHDYNYEVRTVQTIFIRTKK